MDEWLKWEPGQVMSTEDFNWFFIQFLCGILPDSVYAVQLDAASTDNSKNKYLKKYLKCNMQQWHWIQREFIRVAESIRNGVLWRTEANCWLVRDFSAWLFAFLMLLSWRASSFSMTKSYCQCCFHGDSCRQVGDASTNKEDLQKKVSSLCWFRVQLKGCSCHICTH